VYTQNTDNHFEFTFILNTVVCAHTHTHTHTHSVDLEMTVAFIQSVITKFRLTVK